MNQVEFPHSMFDRVALERSVVKFEKGGKIFEQGAACDAIYYVLSGQIKLTVLSDWAKRR